MKGHRLLNSNLVNDYNTSERFKNGVGRETEIFIGQEWCWKKVDGSLVWMSQKNTQTSSVVRDVLKRNLGMLVNYLSTSNKTLSWGCYFQQGMEVKMEMKVDDAYRKSMETSQVFFRTYAPVHFRSGDWRSGGSCHLETLPELNMSLVPNDNWSQFKIGNSLLSSYKNITELVKLKILNITEMTAQRKDGHSSIYYLGPNGGTAALHRQDCSHWCLPGVPDTWNELLYAMFMKHEGFS
ncbi:hypothetical protein HN51_040062 [Arachis hypogaea]